MSRTPRIVVVMPAYNAARTLSACVADVPPNFADEIILVDDASQDDTVKVAHELGLTVFSHPATFAPSPAPEAKA